MIKISITISPAIDQVFIYHFSESVLHITQAGFLYRGINPFMPTVPTFAVQETDVSRTANVGTVGKNWLRRRNGGQKWVKL